MPSKTINSPTELVAGIMGLFPAFAKEWDKGEAFGYKDGCYSYHAVMLTFGPVSKEMLGNASSGQVRKFCELINAAVAQGGQLENAISTCFLEHASKIGVRTIIKPHLSPEASRELR